jgi:hypothetical protein
VDKKVQARGAGEQCRQDNTREVDSREITAGSRKQRAGRRQNRRQDTADSRQQTAVRRQQTADSRQQTADSRQQIEDKSRPPSPDGASVSVPVLSLFSTPHERDHILQQSCNKEERRQQTVEIR